MRAVEGRPGAQLVIISGPSGVGKDSIIAAMQKRTPPHPRHYVVTCTTRRPRDGEVDGVSYLFVSPEDFALLRDDDNLLEASEVHGNWYGTPRDQVQSALVAGHDAILKIDVQGARKVRDSVPDALLVFVVPPSLEVLRERLIGRNADPPADLERRFEDAAYELARQREYDHVVINETDLVERTAQAIDDIIAAEHERYPDRRIRV